MEWSLRVPVEEASPAEMRLLPAAFAHLYRVAPTLEMPEKLRGNVRANFCRTTLLADGSLPIIEKLSRHSPVIVTKGLAICLRFNAWASRPMVDVDIHVPYEALGNACQILAESNWTPRYGMTWDSLMRRRLRRNSWNFTNGTVDVDLHWRLRGSRTEHWLERQMWESGEPVEYSGRKLLIQSAEFALITALNHGLLQGSQSDVLQTVVDSAWLLPLCKEKHLLRLLRRSELLEPFKELLTILDVVMLPERLSARFIDTPKSAPTRHSFKSAAASAVVRLPLVHRFRSLPKRLFLKCIGPLETESAVLRQPFLYWLWNLLGRKSRIERLLLKWTGPFSKPLKPAPTKEEYDLRDCATIDEIGGPGWSWPDPAGICFWGDLADSRLMVPLNHVADYLLVLSLAAKEPSPNGPINVFANGLYVTKIDFSSRISATCSVLITHRMLFGPWVELSFRSKPYSFGRNVPLRKLRIFDLGRVVRILSGNDPAQPSERQQAVTPQDQDRKQ